MKSRRERLLVVLLAVLCIYAFTLKDSISQAITTLFFDEGVTVASSIKNQEILDGGEIPTYTLTIKTEGDGGRVTGAGTYSLGETAVITAIPKVGCKLSAWKGVRISESVPPTTIRIKMNGNYTITAVFAKDTTPSTSPSTHTHTIKYGTNNGWFVTSTEHYMKCSGCGQDITYKNQNNTSSGLIEGRSKHTLNSTTGKCTYCNYQMTTSGQTPGGQTHVCTGVRYNGGSNAGWRVDENSHWVTCTCAAQTKMKGVGSTVKGVNAHNFIGNKCDACGYTKNTSSTPPSTHTHTIKYGTNNGWFVTSTEHYMKCSGCGQDITYKNPNNTSSGLIEGRSKHTLNSTTGKCTYCNYQMTTSGQTPGGQTHVCTGVRYNGGSNAGWRVDENSHWVTCTCAAQTKMKGVGSTVKGVNAHNFIGNKCDACGYERAHTCTGAYTGGTNAGWYVDANSHWVTCTCTAKTKMKAIGSTVKGVNSHDWNGDTCRTCGYKKNTTTTTPITHTHTIKYGSNNGWFATSAEHYMQCTECGEDLTYKDQNNLSSGLIEGRSKHTLNSTTGQCVYCHYQMTAGVSSEYRVTVKTNTTYAAVHASTNIAKKGQKVTIDTLLKNSNNSYEFDKWRVVKGNVTINDPSKLITYFYMPDEDVEIEAVYSGTGMIGRLPYDGEHTISVSVNNSKYGSVKVSPTKAKKGETVTITAYTNDAHLYKFDKWEVVKGNVILAKSSHTTFTMPDENVEIKAILSSIAPEYTVQAVNMTGGTVTPSGTLKGNTGDKFTVEAKPNDGYKFVYWIINGTESFTKDANKVTVTIEKGDVTVYPKFEKIEEEKVEEKEELYIVAHTHTSTIRNSVPVRTFNDEKHWYPCLGGQGCQYRIDEASHVFKYTKHNDYHTITCKYCARVKTEPHSYVNHVCTKCGQENKYRVSLSRSVLNATSHYDQEYTYVSGEGSYKVGTTVTAKTWSGVSSSYEFKGWEENGSFVTGSDKATYTFTMPERDVTLTAVWSPKQPAELNCLSGKHEESDKWQSDNEYHWKKCKHCSYIFENTKVKHGSLDKNYKCPTCKEKVVYTLTRYTKRVGVGETDKKSPGEIIYQDALLSDGKYRFVRWSVTDSSGKELSGVTAEPIQEGTMYAVSRLKFTMPYSNVTIKPIYGTPEQNCAAGIHEKSGKLVSLNDDYHAEKCKYCDYLFLDTQKRHTLNGNLKCIKDCGYQTKVSIAFGTQTIEKVPGNFVQLTAPSTNGLGHKFEKWTATRLNGTPIEFTAARDGARGYSWEEISFIMPPYNVIVKAEYADTHVCSPKTNSDYNSNGWWSDATYHWKECSGQYCSEQLQKAEHTISYGKCTVCNRKDGTKYTVTIVMKDAVNNITGNVLGTYKYEGGQNVGIKWTDAEYITVPIGIQAQFVGWSSPNINSTGGMFGAPDKRTITFKMPDHDVTLYAVYDKVK